VAWQPPAAFPSLFLHVCLGEKNRGPCSPTSEITSRELLLSCMEYGTAMRLRCRAVPWGARLGCGCHDCRFTAPLFASSKILNVFYHSIGLRWFSRLFIQLNLSYYSLPEGLGWIYFWQVINGSIPSEYNYFYHSA
jgi:hypothetical protein